MDEFVAGARINRQVQNAMRLIIHPTFIGQSHIFRQIDFSQIVGGIDPGVDDWPLPFFPIRAEDFVKVLGSVAIILDQEYGTLWDFGVVV